MNLYDKLPLGYDNMPTMKYFKAEIKYTDAVFVVFPGGSYTHLAMHEGEGYAKLLNTWGIDVFVVNYSLAPNMFPSHLNDAKRAVQIVRANADEYGVNPDKIVVMGSSAGGHLAASLATYKWETEKYADDEISKENFLPNYQVLCYPVIDFSDDEITHKGSRNVLLGENYDEEAAKRLSPQLACDNTTAPAFIWHNADDNVVNVFNSMNYAKSLTACGVPVEMHIFPFGNHGVGTAADKHCGQWTNLLFNWLKEMKIY